MNITKLLSQIGKQLACLALALTFANSIASAAIIAVAAVGGGPAPILNTYVSFDEPGVNLGSGPISLPGLSVTFQPDAQVVAGGLSGQYAPPYFSGANDFNFTNTAIPVGGIADPTKYITSGSTGNIPTAIVSLQFTESQQNMGLLWGSVDAYNTLRFYKVGGGTEDLLGSQVTVPNPPNGFQLLGGTYYVNISTDFLFNKVEVISSQYAFEFDNVAFVSQQNIGDVPEPASLAIWGLGAIGLAVLRARRKKLLIG